ncbi:deoxyribodipyrimidine photo-lyase [Saccharothrix tamanrassetensis]|uniref:Deoxyribodipyrimidine photo-lyase n=1 Tax=Saccharothrix tamanrassetensis TaxID=1051531 RepID=A0A841CHM2_9PSEU|nr:deoxyribodipyrimidine photo-lyase [Saccharothrix tamanrassetensis]MBB5956480.1 deoxyribodipyrimidine photo-lyase [Saccharothrix tamanrassetensis]
MDSSTVVWFRRDLRVADHPALLAAAERAQRGLALYVLDPRLLKVAGRPRVEFMFRCLRSLDSRLGGRLMVVSGDPVEVVPSVARSVGAASVHVSADAGPYGRERDAAVAEKVELVRVGSPYAVAPGRVLKPDGTPYRVFTPFYRAWQEHGWREPADTDESTVEWIEPDRSEELPAGEPLPDVAALWERFRDERLPDYARDRDRPDLDGTSRLSPYLRWGVLHPRTLLADLGGDEGSKTFRSELAWRDFYADVLWHQPESARRNYDQKFDRMELDADRERFEAWCAGRTGYPFVDAGMRQLLAEGWMHNRMRMVVASFLVKDLHLPWWWGARHFMKHLVDGDLASNQHGWQWAAGTGTDAAPYFRVFNPVTQGEKFDPNGDYVRKYVPELRGIPGKAVHQPRDPIVDHAHERQVALARYGAIKN